MRVAILSDLKVKVGSGGHAGSAHSGDHLSRQDGGALLHTHIPTLTVESGQAVSVIQNQVVSSLGVKSGLRHGAIRRCQNHSSLICRDIHASVEGTILLLTVGIAEADGPAVLHRPFQPAALVLVHYVDAVDERLVITRQLGQNVSRPVRVINHFQLPCGERIGSALHTIICKGDIHRQMRSIEGVDERPGRLLQVFVLIKGGGAVLWRYPETIAGVRVVILCGGAA